jgi:hypothetical protein
VSRKARPATVGAAPKRASAYPVPYALETDWPVGAAGFEPLHLHFERDPIPYALETDWPLEAAGFEPLHLEIRSAELHRANVELGPPVSV